MLPTKEERDSAIKAAKAEEARQKKEAEKLAKIEADRLKKENEEKLKKEKEGLTTYVAEAIRSAINKGKSRCEINVRNHTYCIIKDIVAEINKEEGYSAKLEEIRTEEFEYTNYESGAGDYRTYYIPHIKVNWE